MISQRVRGCSVGWKLYYSVCAIVLYGALEQARAATRSTRGHRAAGQRNLSRRGGRGRGSRGGGDGSRGEPGGCTFDRPEPRGSRECGFGRRLNGGAQVAWTRRDVAWREHRSEMWAAGARSRAEDGWFNDHGSAADFARLGISWQTQVWASSFLCRFRRFV